MSSCQSKLNFDQIGVQAEKQVVTVEAGVPEGWLGLDIGPDSLANFTAELSDCKTVIWNGPMGVFEMSK